MCFTIEVTMGMMAMNLSMALFLHLRGKAFRQYQIFYVFFIMELLQFLQYLVLDDCGHWLNQLTTVLAYVHVCFQPIAISYYVLGPEPNIDVIKTVIRLGFIGGCMLVIRLPYLGVSQFLSEHLSWMGNEFPDNSQAGTHESCSRTAMCGPQLCARTGNAHLRWEIPLLPSTYFIPGDFMHFFLFFMPLILVPGYVHAQRLGLVLVTFLLGPVLAMTWTYAAAGDAYRLEWPAIWCAYSGMQCVIGLVAELCMDIDEATKVGTRHNYLWIEKLNKGLLFDSRKYIPASLQKGTGVAYEVMADATKQKGRDQQRSKKAA